MFNLWFTQALETPKTYIQIIIVETRYILYALIEVVKTFGPHILVIANMYGPFNINCFTFFNLKITDYIENLYQMIIYDRNDS